MKDKLFIWLLVLIIIFIAIEYFFEIVSFVNSHYGSNHSTKESDNKKKVGGNLISKVYDYEINRCSKICPFNQYLPTDLMPMVHAKDLTKAKFVKYSNNFSTPLLIKGFFLNCKAVNKWSLQFFKNNYGETKLPTIKNAAIEEHKKYFKTDKTQYQFISLSEFVDRLESGKKSYVNNVSRIFAYHPELIDDLELEKIKPVTGIDMKNSNNVTHIFIGGRGTGTSLHSSITGNFFYNIKGKKKWYLIHPKYSKYLKPSLSKTGLFAVSQYDICDAKKGDYILNIPRYEIVLDEGDLLFNPPWWWHAVSNETQYTIGCANRFSNFEVAHKNNPLYTTIFFSHPIQNYKDFYQGMDSREKANLKFDKALLRDILREEKSLK